MVIDGRSEGVEEGMVVMEGDGRTWYPAQPDQSGNSHTPSLVYTDQSIGAQ